MLVEMSAYHSVDIEYYLIIIFYAFNHMRLLLKFEEVKNRF